MVVEESEDDIALSGSQFDDPEAFLVSERLKAACRWTLIERSIAPASTRDPQEIKDRIKTTKAVAELFDPIVPIVQDALGGQRLVDKVYSRRAGRGFSRSEMLELIAARFIFTSHRHDLSIH